MQRALLTATLLTLPILYAHAQATAPTHAPDGGVREHLQSASTLPKRGTPFSATVATEWTRSVADASTTTLKNVRLVARDSAGHIFQERLFLTPTGDTAPSLLLSLPATRSSTWTSRSL